MNYVDIILTTDKLFYIGPAWEVKPGDMIGVTDQFGDQLIKTVEEVITKEYGGEVTAFIEKYTDCPLQKIDARYRKYDAKWPDEKEEDDVSE